MSQHTRRVSLAAATLAMTGLLAACGGSGGSGSSTSTSASGGGASSSSAGTSSETASTEKQQVKVQLQWVTQAQFACYYAAKDQGPL
jgi:NitT/TauT family transport system substrate-binding protein